MCSVRGFVVVRTLALVARNLSVRFTAETVHFERKEMEIGKWNFHWHSINIINATLRANSLEWNEWESDEKGEENKKNESHSMV